MCLIRARPSPQSSIQTGPFNNVLTSAPRHPPVFYSSNDGPTSRHDNDASFFQNIQILPTADEVLAIDKPVYMPKRDLREPNPIPSGVDRLLDLSFRQLRYESVEQITDVCCAAAQRAFLASSSPFCDQGASESTFSQAVAGPLEPRQKTPIGNRYFLYTNVQVEELLAHETLSVLVRVSFDCPQFMRGSLMHRTGRFEEGMLVALICLDTSVNELEIFYLQVHLRQSTQSMNNRGGQARKAAVQYSFLPNTTTATVTRFAQFAQKLCPELKMCLVKFPKLLHAGFYNCLNRLQKLQGFAFSRIVAPHMSPQQVDDQIRHHRVQGRSSVHACRSPQYAEAADFQFDLSPITKPGAAVEMAQYTLSEVDDLNSIPMIESMTTLDQGQAAAVRHSLRSELAFTQGPPGTGKTYVAIALTRVLLASRPSSRKKPILVVCLTNHALDSFLGGLKAAGVENLLRIGSRSKEGWTDSINLREKRKKMRHSHREMSTIHYLQGDAEPLYGTIDCWCRGQSGQTLTGNINWFSVGSFLFDYHREVYDQFQSAALTPSILTIIFDFWAKGADLQNIVQLRESIAGRLAETHGNADAEEILNGMTLATTEQQTSLGTNSVWTLSASERTKLLQEWSSSVDNTMLANKLGRWYTDHQSLLRQKQEIRDDRDARVLQQADVIGMTTTACAGKWDLLNRLDLELLICEEAREVLEPHVLCTLLPTIQHAVFIGDPQQLRPEVSEHVLSIEHTSNYRLDESLFEKMICPRDPALSTLPMAQLNIQRRMHSRIADISRITYPFLQDHPSTWDREPTIGLQQRVFWWDHRVFELEDTVITKSHANPYEVQMVVGLVKYLLKGGAYSQGDIAVITPYSGQLASLCQGLQATCTIWLNERDRELLLSEDAFDAGKVDRKKEVVSLAAMLRVATVDNFQGQEAKIVILSTVRSGGRLGFLSIPNRINVACSRAKNGFYVVGNSKTLEQVGIWRDITQLLGPRCGFELMTKCSNHPDHGHAIYGPEDFEWIP